MGSMGTAAAHRDECYNRTFHICSVCGQRSRMDWEDEDSRTRMSQAQLDRCDVRKLHVLFDAADVYCKELDSKGETEEFALWNTYRAQVRKTWATLAERMEAASNAEAWAAERAAERREYDKMALARNRRKYEKEHEGDGSWCCCCSGFDD